MRRFVLDTGVLGALCHPRKNLGVARWMEDLLKSGAGYAEFYVPAISDYELRRKLLHLKTRDPGIEKSLERLEEICKDLSFLPLSTTDLRRAAEYWARLRARGKPGAHDHALDGDVILAAQAKSVD